jgi:tripartite-type tricarboxylate transporter receptor subunit TctC
MADRYLINRRTVLGGILSASVLRPDRALADNFPTGPIKWICFQAAGGTADLTLRAAQPFLAAQGLKTQIDYVTGGGGTVARTEIYNAAPDGYTIMVDSAPNTALSEVVLKTAFKSAEIEPIFGWCIEGWQICTKKGSPVQTLKDLVALSQKRPIVAGSIGRGAASHLQLILLQQVLGIKMNIVHFSGSAQAYPQVIGGNIDIACTGPGSASRTADQLQFLCIFRQHEPALPSVLSATAQGYDVPSIDQIWYAQTAPKVPPDRLAKLEAVFKAACAGPDFAAAQAKIGLLTVEPTPRERLRRILDEGYQLALKYEKELTAG